MMHSDVLRTVLNTERLLIISYLHHDQVACLPSPTLNATLDP